MTEKQNDPDSDEKNGNMKNIYEDVHLDLMNPLKKYFRNEIWTSINSKE
jgi:hypothetical protein